MHLQFCLADTTWCQVKIHFCRAYCLPLNPSLKCVSPLKHSSTYIKKKRSQLLNFSSCLLIYSSKKRQGACPRGLDLFLHQAWMDTISGKAAAQLNFWNSTDCAARDKGRLNNAYVTDQIEVQTLCTRLAMEIHAAQRKVFLCKFTLLMNQ